MAFEWREAPVALLHVWSGLPEQAFIDGVKKYG